HLRELELDRLVVGDRLAESLPFLGVADRLLEPALRDPDRPGGDVHAAELDPAHEVPESSVLAGFATENASERRSESVKCQLDRLDALVSELFQRRTNLQAGL